MTEQKTIMLEEASSLLGQLNGVFEKREQTLQKVSRRTDAQRRTCVVINPHIQLQIGVRSEQQMRRLPTFGSGCLQLQADCTPCMFALCRCV